MSSISSGSGVGSMGGPIQPSIRELETTAATDVAKLAMKLVADTLDTSLILVDYDTRRYQSSSNRPVLAPLISIRVRTSFDALPDESWKPVYDQLVDSMPKKFRDVFLLSLQMPFASRNINFVIFDNILQTLAKASVLLSDAAMPLDPESLAALHTEQNLALPYIALNSVVLQGEFLLAEAQAFLSLVGPNYVNFDALVNLSSQLGSIVSDLKTATYLLQDESQSAAASLLIASVGARIDVLRAAYAKLGGSELLMLGATLNAMSIVTAAMSLDNIGSKALALDLALVSLAINSSVSPLGLIGPSILGTAQAVTAGLLAAYLPNADLGTRLLLNELIGAALIGSVIFGALIYDSGFGLPPLTGNESPAELALRAFAFTTTITAFVSSDIVPTILKGISQAISNGEDVQDAIQQILKMIALLLMILAGLQSTSPAASAAIMRGLKEVLKDGLDTTSNAINQAVQSGQVSEDTASELTVYVQQAKIALDNDNFGAFLDALNGAIGLSGSSNEDFFKDLKDLKNLATSLRTALAGGNDDSNTFTGISVAA